LNTCISSIDWSAAKDILSIAGTAAALFISWFGLNTWRKQLQGTNEYELAKKVMLLTYEVEEAIQNIRSPMLLLNKEEVEAGNRLHEEQRIYDERLKFFSMKWAQLQAVKLESKVLWKSAEHSFNDLNNIISELKAALWLHFWMKGAYAGPGAIVDRNPDRVRRNDVIVYFVSEQDEFTVKIKNAVRTIEIFFENKVRRK